MICRHCGIEFDTSGITGDTLRCPGCGMLYRRKAPAVSRDPRAGLTVPVFIPKGQAIDFPEMLPREPEKKPDFVLPAKEQPVQAQTVNPARAAAWGQPDGNNPKPDTAAPGQKKRKKTHHIRTALILFLLVAIAVTVLSLTGLGDIFPRATDEIHTAEETVTEEPAEQVTEEPEENIEWFG